MKNYEDINEVCIIQDTYDEDVHRVVDRQKHFFKKNKKTKQFESFKPSEYSHSTDNIPSVTYTLYTTTVI